MRKKKYHYEINTDKTATDFIIYKITSPSGKRYIGLTKNLQRRIGSHIGDSKRKINYPIYRAFLKYGIENMKWEIIDYANNYEELIELEKYWIDKLKTYNEYNISLGGEGANGAKRTRQQRENKATKSGTKPFKVYTLSNQYLGEWLSYSLCSEESNIGSGGAIADCLKNKTVLHNKYVIVQFNKIDDVEIIIQKYCKKHKLFVVYDMNLESYKEYTIITKCSKDYKISAPTIRKCLKRKLLFFKQYIFIYKDDLININEIIKNALKQSKIFNVYDLHTKEYLGTWTDVQKCAEYLKIDYTDIYKYMKTGQWNSWKHVFICKWWLSENNLEKAFINSQKNIKVFNVYTLDGQHIGKWDNQLLCAKELNLNKTNLNRCLKHRMKNYRGYLFYFTYEDPYLKK